jgi:hypothetical protein
MVMERSLYKLLRTIGADLLDSIACLAFPIRLNSLVHIDRVAALHEQRGMSKVMKILQHGKKAGRSIWRFDRERTAYIHMDKFKRITSTGARVGIRLLRVFTNEARDTMGMRKGSVERDSSRVRFGEYFTSSIHTDMTKAAVPKFRRDRYTREKLVRGRDGGKGYIR